MDALMDFFLGKPLGLAIFGAHFLYFALFAWAVVAVRAIRLRMGRAELVVFAVFTSFIVVEAVQLAVDGSFFRHETWGLPRYFGVFAPLLWLWLAKGLAVKRRIQARELIKGMERNARHFGAITWKREYLYERR